MSFPDAKNEARERFNEARSLLSELRKIAPTNLIPVPQIQKSQRGLWLVSLYAAVERSVNVAVEAAISDISTNSVESKNAVASVHSIFHFSKIKSLRDCSRNAVFDRSVDLFEASSSTNLLELHENPLAESLQNVDGNTMSWVLKLFGAPETSPAPASLGRTKTLRERRNAVAHGRESAAQVGERYTIQELSNYYDAADEVTNAFISTLSTHCMARNYASVPA